MLPILTARESLTAATRHAMGSGTLEREAADRIHFDWQTVGRVTPERSTVPTPAELHAMGVDPSRKRARRG